MFLMSDSEVFREVDEDYRRDRMIAFWRRYGTALLVAAVFVMAAASGINYLSVRAQAQKEADTAEFEALLAGIQPGNEQQSIAALADYATRAKPAEATLAMFTEASLRQRSGNSTAAAQVYHQIADGNQASADLRDLAVVRLGYLAADAATPEPLIPRLQGIADAGSPWRFSAREAIALLTARAGQRESAAKMFSDLAQDPATPIDLAGRARALAELYRGK
ncbi:MAG: hypothetical protein JWM91_211 [Rhodospirillales bacterium]|nr:hypothetical protein [Rhodospirillales bacterium]